MTSLKTVLSRGAQGLSLVALLALSACGDRSFNVTTQFASADGVELGEAVIYEGQPVGTVAGIDESLEGVTVELALDPESVTLFHTKSVVVVNSMEQGSPLEIYNRTTSDPIPLAEGQALQGLNSMFELGAWLVGDAVQLGSGTLSDLFDSFTGYLQGEQFAADKQAVEQQLSQAALAAQEAVKTVETDLSAALQELKASEGEMSEAIAKMGEELSPVVRELSASGSELIQQLEEFARNVEEQAQENPQLGQDLVQSLVQVLDELNAQVNGQITVETEEGAQTYQLESEAPEGSTDSSDKTDTVN